MPPEEPVDPGAFLRNLPPSLRQQILTDMDDSQFSVLPEDLSTQAQSLRREFEARQARMMQERFAFGDSEAASAISTLLRRSGFPRRIGRIGRGGLQFSRLLPPTSGWGNRVPGFAAASLLGKDKKNAMTGRQVLDNEALACLLILLFLDEPRLNVNRLHKVIRNFCYHEETRLSVIQSLISVLRRTSGQNPDGSCVPGVTAPSRGKGPGKKSESKSTSRSLDDQLGNGEMSSSDSTQSSVNSSWLNMSVDAALGCRARIFNVQKTNAKSTAEKCATNVSINTQAASFVCKHVVDALACLAKHFPASFTPVQVKTQPSCTEKVSSCNNTDSPSGSTVGEASASNQSEAEFWNILIKLDGTFGGKKGKSSNKQTSLCSVVKRTDFNSAPIGYLMTFLSHPVIRNNPSLMDSLLRLLSVVSLSLPDVSGNKSAANDGTTPALTTSVDTSSAVALPNDSQSTASHGRARTPESVTSSLLVETSPRGLEPETEAENVGLGEVDAVDGDTTNPLLPQETVNEPMDVEMTSHSKVSMNDERAGNVASPVSFVEEETSSLNVIMAPQLRLAVDVLTSGACSEDGLEDATTLLLQVSTLNSDTRDAVLSLLLMGVRRLGHVLQDHISNLLDELKNYNATHGTISPNERTQKVPLQQVLQFQRLNRPVSTGNPAARLFTEHRLATGTGTRGARRRNTGQQRHIRSLTYDLHLPAMAALTEKTSSQNLFLRGLRVILQLRVAARKAALAAKRQEEKRKEQGEFIL